MIKKRIRLLLVLTLAASCKSISFGRTMPPMRALPGAEVQPFVSGEILATAFSDQLRFKVIPSQWQESQSLKYVRLAVRGPGIPQRLENQEGFLDTAAPDMTLSLQVPRGQNRVLTVQGYDSQRQVLPEAVLKALYSSPLLNETQFLVPKKDHKLAEVVECLLDKGSSLTATLDAQQLPAWFDPLLANAQLTGTGACTLATELERRL